MRTRVVTCRGRHHTFCRLPAASLRATLSLPALDGLAFSKTLNGDSKYSLENKRIRLKPKLYFNENTINSCSQSRAYPASSRSLLRVEQCCGSRRVEYSWRDRLEPRSRHAARIVLRKRCTSALRWLHSFDSDCADASTRDEAEAGLARTAVD